MTKDENLKFGLISIIKLFFFEFADRETIQKIGENIAQFLYKEGLFDEETNPIVVGVNFFLDYSYTDSSFNLRTLPDIDTELSYKILTRGG